MVVKKRGSNKKKASKGKALKDQVRDPIDEVVEPAKEKESVVLVWEETKPGRLEASGRFAVVKITTGYVLYDTGNIIDIFKGKYALERAQDAAIDILSK